MSTKEKVKFNLVAAIRTILKFPKLIDSFRDFGYNNTEGMLKNTLILISENPEEGAGKFRLPLIKIFRRDIETNKKYLKFYLSQTEEQKEFSIKIEGSGTKAQIISELQSWIGILQTSTVEQILGGLEIEEPNTVLTTNIPEKYEG